jgi:transposase
MAYNSGNKKKPMKNNSKKLTDKQMEKLREHSKLHPNGMRGKHMRNMVKFMKEGMSFNKAHSKAVKLGSSPKNPSQSAPKK